MVHPCPRVGDFAENTAVYHSPDDRPEVSRRRLFRASTDRNSHDRD